MKRLVVLLLTVWTLFSCSDKEEPSQPVAPDIDQVIEEADSVFCQTDVDGYELIAVSQGGSCAFLETDTTFAFKCLFDSCGMNQLVAFCDSTGVVERIAVGNQVINILYHEDKSKMDILYKKADNTIGWIEDVENPYNKLSSRADPSGVPYSAISVMNHLSYAVFTIIDTYDVCLSGEGWDYVQKYSKPPYSADDVVKMFKYILGKEYKEYKLLITKHVDTIYKVMCDYSNWAKKELYGDAIPLLRNRAIRKSVNDLTLNAYVEGVDSLKTQFKIGVLVTKKGYPLNSCAYLDNKGSQYDPKKVNFACTFNLETGKEYKFRPYLAPVSTSKYLKGMKCLLDYYLYGDIQEHLLLEAKAELDLTEDDMAAIKLSVENADISMEMGLIYGENENLLESDYKKIEYKPTFSESLFTNDFEIDVKLENLGAGDIYYMPYIIYNDGIINKSVYTPTSFPINVVFTKEDWTFYMKKDVISVIHDPVTKDVILDGKKITLKGYFNPKIKRIEKYGILIRKQASRSESMDLTVENSTVIEADSHNEGHYEVSYDLSDEDELVYYRAFIKVGDKYYYGEVKKYTKEYEKDSLREALIQLYHSTGGENWKSNYRWCSNEPVTEWNNVKKSGDKYIIDLSSNNLTGKINQTFPDDVNIELNVNFNNLTSIDISGSTTLTKLNCQFNRLTSLNVSECTALKYLDCTYNYDQLTSLNVLGCTALTELICFENPLTSLDVSECTALKYLNCNYNKLTSLDLSKCTALKCLICRDNQLTSLNISNCTALEIIGCYFNQLTSLDVSGCTALKELSCQGNKILSVIPDWFSQLEDFDYDQRYIYSEEWIDGEKIITYKDNGVGWWYPGEPERGYHWE